MKKQRKECVLSWLYRSLVGVAFVGAFFGAPAHATMVPSQRVDFDHASEVDLSILENPLDDGAAIFGNEETVMVDRDGQEWREEGVSTETPAATEATSQSFDGAVRSPFATVVDDLMESVIGTDERVQVTNTTDVNMRKIGRIALGCTGTLVGPRVVLTAGHCVFNTKTDKWYDNLDFTPGQNGSSKPFPTVKWKRAIAVKGFTKDKKTESDYAVILLDQPVGDQLGWFAYGHSSDLGSNTTVNVNGYPGDKPAGTMWHSACKIADAKAELLYHPCDTFGGNSGSGMYLYKAATNERTIYGVHTNGGNPNNWGTRITKAKFDKIKGWKAENP